MVKRISLVSLTLFILCTLLFGVASAQGYLFSLEKEAVVLDLRADGTAGIDYTLEFNNHPGASPIEYVDLGLPNGSYDLGSVKADVNGQPVTDITKADPQNLAGGSDGITVALGSLAIPPGQRGTVHIFIGTSKNMLYPSTNTNVQNYVSVNFAPAYWISSIVTGNTDMTVTFHLPPGINTDQPIYYPPQGGWPGQEQPESGFDNQDRIYYLWHATNANAYTQYTFGAGFPASVIPASAIVRQPAVQIPSQILFCLGFGVLFLGFAGWSIYRANVTLKKRKLAYLPPKISIEGHGIKRGLTAVEAALLMEQPIDKILTMVLFSVIKKGAATVVTKDPLEIEVNPTPPPDLQPYEQEFLAAFKDKKGKDRRSALQDMMINLIKSVSEKMKGFSTKETVAYYESIINDAWKQVEAAGTPEVKSQKYEEVMDWTMLDRNFGDRTRTVFGSGPVFLPIWWGNYDPVFRTSGGGSAGVPISTSTGGSQAGGGGFKMPSLPGSDFAASVVNGASTFAAGILGDVTSFTGGITNKTNPPPPPPTTTGGSGWHGSAGGGGSHCACACACACAGCACACAGGGR